jgi:glycosyltransferase involved in cell wall biosynthesis
MPTQPLLTGVIPFRNRYALVREAVQSVLSAFLDNLEVVCIDNGSDEPGIEDLHGFLSQYASVVCERIEDGTGPGSAKNKGIDLAQGEWLFFMNSGDLVLPEGLKKLVASLPAQSADMLQFSQGVASWRFLFRRDFLLREDLRYDEAHPYADDNLFTPLAASKAWRLVQSAENFYVHRTHKDAVKSSVPFAERAADTQFVMRELLGMQGVPLARLCLDALVAQTRRYQRLTRDENKQNIIIWGTGAEGEKALRILEQEGVGHYKVLGFATSDSKFWGTEKCGLPVFAPEALKDSGADVVLVALAKDHHLA